MVPIGIIVVVLCVIMVIGCVVSMIFSGGLKYPKVANYTLDQQWDHAPLLFSATDIDPMTLSHHVETTDTEGAVASGKW